MPLYTCIHNGCVRVCIPRPLPLMPVLRAVKEEKIHLRFGNRNIYLLYTEVHVYFNKSTFFIGTKMTLNKFCLVCSMFFSKELPFSAENMKIRIVDSEQRS